jgi:hypothetical protein
VYRSYTISPYNLYVFLISGTRYDVFRVTRKCYTRKRVVIDRKCALLSSVLMRGRKILRKNALGMFVIGIISAYLRSSVLAALHLKLNLCVCTTGFN